MASTKVDAHQVRMRDALVLPFKRRIASLTIRADIWQSEAHDKATSADAREKARAALEELDGHVAALDDTKFPPGTETPVFLSDLKDMRASYAGLRKVLTDIAAA